MSYRVIGRDIYDNGQKIVLSSMNWQGNDAAVNPIFFGLWSAKPDHMLTTLKNNGFNCVRIPFAHWLFENKDVTKDMDAEDWQNFEFDKLGSLDIFDKMIDYFERYGIRYIFSHHYSEDGYPGRIPPRWYTINYSEEQWLEDLSFIADRYEGRRGFVGIDIKNEPDEKGCTYGDGNYATDWKIAIEKAYEAINAVNKDILIIGEWIGLNPGLIQMTRNPPNVPKDRFVYSGHLYGYPVWRDGEGFKDPSFPKNMPAIWDRFFGNEALNNCFFVGEFGGFYTEQDKIWQDAFVDYLISRGIYNYAYWTFTATSGDTGGYLLDDRADNVNPGKQALLKRLRTPYSTFTTDKPAPVPTPTPTPTPTPKPSPEPAPMPTTDKFKEGDIVRLITGNGQDMIVTGYQTETPSGKRLVGVCYYNSLSGLMVGYALTETAIKKKTVTAQPSPK